MSKAGLFVSIYACVMKMKLLVILVMLASSVHCINVPKTWLAQIVTLCADVEKNCRPSGVVDVAQSLTDTHLHRYGELCPEIM